MSQTDIILLVAASCVVVAAVITVICCVVAHKNHVKAVKANSEYYAKILKLNSAYTFHADFQSVYKFYEICASKRKLEKLSLDDVLLAKIDENFLFYENLLLRVEQNNQAYERYCKKYSALGSTMTAEKSKALKISLRTFLKLEKKLCEKSKLCPQLSTAIYIKASYTSPQGRNSYYKEKTFPYTEMVNAYQTYIDLKNRQQEYSYQVKIERAKMTDSLRYNILKRDEFRCQLCGATAQEGAKLHVDHIIPVSKGGKTVSANLRTLCDRCNIGKSNKMEWD